MVEGEKRTGHVWPVPVESSDPEEGRLYYRRADEGKGWSQGDYNARVISSARSFGLLPDVVEGFEVEEVLIDGGVVGKFSLHGHEVAAASKVLN